MSLESNNYSVKVIPKIENEKGDMINDQSGILNETKKYQNLFTDKNEKSEEDSADYVFNTYIQI